MAKIKKMGELSAGVGSQPKRQGPVDPKGAWTKVQERALAGTKSGKSTLKKDKHLGATKKK